MSDDIFSDLIPEDDAAGILQQKPGTLRQWRWQHRGPSYIKIGKRIFYRKSALAEWVTAQARNPSPAR
jgi:Helix-turn-helix domain